MTTRCDILIVGGGPAGLMAARTAAAEGLNVVLVDRKKDIPKIHRSCGGVLNLNEPTFGEVVTFDEQSKQISFTKAGTTIRYDGPYRDVYGFHLYTPGGKRLEFGNFSELRQDPGKNRLGLSLSKEQLLRTLLDESQELGLSVFPDTNVVTVRKEPGGVVVTCEDGRTFEASFVIAADGINSRIARVLGMNKNRQFFGTTRDTSLTVRGTGCPDPEGFLFMITPRSIFSMIPVAKEDCYHVYATTYRRDEKPADLLNYLVHDDPTFSAWFKDSTILADRSACVVTVMSPMEKPFKDNVLFVGDASWRREMSNVGSMSSGFKAGKTVAEALKQGTPDEAGIRDYLDWYNEHYFVPLGNRKQGGRNINDYLTPDDMDYLVGLPDKLFPRTLDIIKVVNLIGKCYADLMTRIYEERPETMDRLMKMREKMDDDLQQMIKWGFRIG